MAEFLRRMSLKTRVTLVAFVFLMAGIWGLAARVAGLVQADLERVLFDQLSGTADYVVADLDNAINLRTAVLNEIAASITPEVLADPAKIRQVLDKSNVSSEIFPRGLIVTDKEGTYIAEYPTIAGRLGISLRDTRFFQEIMGGAKKAVGRAVIGRTAKQPLFPVAVQLRDASGTAAGMLFGSVLSSHPALFGALEQSKIGGNGYLLVISPMDKLIVSATDKSRILQPAPARGANPLLDRWIEQGVGGIGRTVSSLGVEVLTVYRNMRTTGWVVVAAIPTEEAFAPIAALKREIYLTALLLSLLGLLILHLVLARQLSPLQAAGAAMRRMTEGKESLAAIPVVRDDEIGELIGNFNRLAVERAGMEDSLRNEIAERKKTQGHLEIASKRLQALSEHIRRIQDAERRMIAFELHEELGQELTTLKLQLQMLERHCVGEEAKLRLEDARMVAELMLDRVRDMAFGLHPSQLDDFGLAVALRQYCAEQGDKEGWSMHFDVSQMQDRPDREVELACFRVAQEALTNVARHAHASEVWVRLHQSADELQLQFRDNGIGFDTGVFREEERIGNFGLMGLEERVRQAGGRLEIKSSPGGGTEIDARFFPQPQQRQTGAPARPVAG
jgi:signal transduction histidine kinase